MLLCSFILPLFLLLFFPISLWPSFLISCSCSDDCVLLGQLFIWKEQLHQRGRLMACLCVALYKSLIGSNSGCWHLYAQGTKGLTAEGFQAAIVLLWILCELCYQRMCLTNMHQISEVWVHFKLCFWSNQLLILWYCEKFRDSEQKDCECVIVCDALQ